MSKTLLGQIDHAVQEPFKILTDSQIEDLEYILDCEAKYENYTGQESWAVTGYLEFARAIETMTVTAERAARDIEIERLDRECQQLRAENENLKDRLAHSEVELQQAVAEEHMKMVQHGAAVARNAVYGERGRCVQWLRDNYQDHSSVASICEALYGITGDRT